MAEREWEYSMCFTVSNTHHTFWDKMCFVMSLASFQASIGEPFRPFCVLLGVLFDVLFFTTFQGNRVTASNSGSGGVGSLKQLPPCPASGQGPTQNRPPRPRDPRDAQPQGKDRPRTGPPGTPGTCRQESQTGEKDHKSMNRNWHASPLKARWRICK